MSFQQYLQTISSIDPGKIYVENIRSFMNVSSHKARTLCEMAVRENLFSRKIGLVCPNDGRILAEYDNDNKLPDQISCHICEVEGRDPSVFKTSQLQKVIFYKLNQ